MKGWCILLASAATNLSLIHGYPLGCCEPPMIFNVIHSVLEVSITLGKVHLKWQEYMIKISKRCTNLVHSRATQFQLSQFLLKLKCPSLARRGKTMAVIKAGK